MHALRTVFAVPVVLAALGAGLAAPQPASATTGTPSSSSVTAARTAARVSSVSSSYEKQVLILTNRARKKHGLRALVPASCTERRSTGWARSMAARHTLQHQSMRTLAMACGTTYVGENIARGPGLTPARVVNLWMHSKGHRANILNRKYRHLGVGAYNSGGLTYVVQDFRK